MNQKDWKMSDKFPGKFEWYNKTRKLQKSLVYNEDKNATVIHHLRDTEEQRKYNDEHYELWGFEIDENGNEHFEYGKYVIFVTKEEHTNIHKCSEETKQKISEAKEQYWTEESRALWSIQMSGEGNGFYGKRHSDETKMLISKNRSGKCVGEKHPFYGKHHTEESRMKMSEALSGEKNPRFGKKGKDCPIYGRKTSDETKKKISESNKGKHSGEKNGMFGKKPHNYGKKASESTKLKLQVAANKRAELYRKYKEIIDIQWHQFLSLIKQCRITLNLNELPTLEELLNFNHS